MRTPKEAALGGQELLICLHRQSEKSEKGKGLSSLNFVIETDAAVLC